MAEETDEDAHILDELGAHFNSGYIGGVVSERVKAIQAEMNETVQRIQWYLPYLAGLYYSDSQRSHAERYVFSLQAELAAQLEEMTNTLVIAVDLNRPVTVKTT